MVSYWKTQWFSFTIGIIWLVAACIFAFQPAGDPNTLEGLNQDLSNLAQTSLHLIGSVLWILGSIIEYNKDCINKLNERIEVLEKQIKEN